MTNDTVVGYLRGKMAGCMMVSGATASSMVKLLMCRLTAIRGRASGLKASEQTGLIDF